MKVLDALVGIGVCDRTENPTGEYFERYDFQLEADNAFPSLDEINLLSEQFGADHTSLNFTYNDNENRLYLEFWFKNTKVTNGISKENES